MTDNKTPHTLKILAMAFFLRVFLDRESISADIQAQPTAWISARKTKIKKNFFPWLFFQIAAPVLISIIFALFLPRPVGEWFGHFRPIHNVQEANLAENAHDLVIMGGVFIFFTALLFMFDYFYTPIKPLLSALLAEPDDAGDETLFSLLRANLAQRWKQNASWASLLPFAKVIGWGSATALVEVIGFWLARSRIHVDVWVITPAGTLLVIGFPWVLLWTFRVHRREKNRRGVDKKADHLL